MCERCWLDLMMYGEPAGHEAPVWEKGRFQAQAVEPSAGDDAKRQKRDGDNDRTERGEQE